MGTSTQYFSFADGDLFLTDNPKESVDNFRPLNDAQRAQALEALALWDDVSGFMAVMRDDDDRLARDATTFQDGKWATSLANDWTRIGLGDPSNPDHDGLNAPSGANGRYHEAFVASTAPGSSTFATGSQAFNTLLHELGHSVLGPDHIEVAPEKAIMSPNSRHASTPMTPDIDAAIALYGPELFTRNGDDTYGFNARFSGSYRSAFDFAVNRTPLVTIFDNGGTDTLDASGFSNGVHIDLSPGAESWEIIGSARATFAVIYKTTVIENAVGTAFGDVIFGNDDSNTLSGGGGNDILNGWGGDDVLFGGTGDDTYNVDQPGDMVVDVRGDEGGLNDKIYTSLNSYDMSVYDGNEWIEHLQFVGQGDFVGHGNALNNSVVGGAGADRLFGLDGHDWLVGGEGEDKLEGGEGDDWLNGEGGADTLLGGMGNDTYVVGEGDRVVEDAARSVATPFGRVFMSAGIDTVETGLREYGLSENVENLTFLEEGSREHLGAGNGLDNVMRGSRGNETLFGGGGNDIFDAGGGSNRLSGGEGKDTFVLRDMNGNMNNNTVVTDFDFGVEQLDMRLVTGFTSFDQVEKLITDTAEGARITLPFQTITLAGVQKSQLTAANFIFAPRKELIGTLSGDTLFGDDNAEHLQGLAGDDILIGRAGPDLLDGGDGVDIADYSASAAGISISLLTGVGQGGDAEGDTLINIEQAIGSAHDDTFEGGDWIRGQFVAGDGNDTMIGGSWFDWFEGGNGDDTFIGTGGQMVMFGGDGDDTMTGSLDNSNYFDAGTGNDTMVGGDSVDYMADVIGGDDSMHAGGGDDTMVDLFGATQLYGEGGNDFMSAAGGNGLLDGGGGNEYMSVANGDYTVVGGAGDDTLEFAGTGNTSFTGGEGADVFTYRVTWGSMVVTDFEDGVDHIYLWDNHYYGNVPLESLAIEDSADGAVISWNGMSRMTLTGIQASQLTQEDFVL